MRNRGETTYLQETGPEWNFGRWEYSKPQTFWELAQQQARIFDREPSNGALSREKFAKKPIKKVANCGGSRHFL